MNQLKAADVLRRFMTFAVFIGTGSIIFPSSAGMAASYDRLCGALQPRQEL